LERLAPLDVVRPLEGQDRSEPTNPRSPSQRAARGRRAVLQLGETAAQKQSFMGPKPSLVANPLCIRDDVPK
jgi:hypothetical protein